MPRSPKKKRMSPARSIRGKEKVESGGLVEVPVQQIKAFFSSKAMMRAKEQILDIGRRLWHRAYVDANGGNISLRVAKNLVLCTPTLVSKGFMKPADLCLVDLQGTQMAGTLPRTSEILMHLAIYQVQPRAVACVHAHPPHATGFAVAGVSPPMCMIPEMEIFCGEVPVAEYMTPGSHEIGEAVANLVDTHNTVLMGNHGVVAWGTSVEDAYFKIEILEAYCRTVLVARQLKSEPNQIQPHHMRELLQIKERLGLPDPRIPIQGDKD